MTLRDEWNRELADKAGECLCPVFEDGRRGFRGKCPVHGQRTKEDFARLTALRTAMFNELHAPPSAHGRAKT